MRVKLEKCLLIFLTDEVLNLQAKKLARLMSALLSGFRQGPTHFCVRVSYLSVTRSSDADLLHETYEDLYSNNII